MISSPENSFFINQKALKISKNLKKKHKVKFLKPGKLNIPVSKNGRCEDKNIHEFFPGRINVRISFIRKFGTH